MTASVVAISRVTAAGGEEVGQRVADTLGYHYVDQEVIVGAAEKAGVEAEEVERAEHAPSIIERLMESLAMAPMNPVTEAGTALVVAPSGFLVYQRLIKQVITEIGRKGRAVIVAHAASIPLAGMDGLLRVHITAPPAARIARLERHPSMKKGKAKSLIKSSDRARADYLNRFYGVKREAPELYDLVINTDVITPEQASSLVVAAARGL